MILPPRTKREARASREAVVRAAEIIVQTCLGITPADVVLVVADANTRGIGERIRDKAVATGAQVILAEIPVGDHPGAEAMKASTVVVAPTTMSVTHTSARRQACAAGARVATLPGITEAILGRALALDYGEMAGLSEAVGRLLDDGESLRLTSPAGTDLRVDLGARKAIRDTGNIHSPGAYGNLPAGEAYIAPIEGTANGVVVIDGSMSAFGLLDEPLLMTFEAGNAVAFEGGRQARVLRALLDQVGPQARNLAEVGIGTNPSAIVGGAVLEDEKVKGTVHVALGNNVSFGGRDEVAIHLDGIILRPTLEIDGRALIREGRFAI